jgi:hypothetical protein
MFFDAGIFAVVAGSTLLTLIALAHRLQSIRGRRLAAVAGGRRIHSVNRP